MSTHAATRQRTQAAVTRPSMSWVQNITSRNPFLMSLNGCTFQIICTTPDPNGLLTEFEGHTDTTPQITFQGSYASDQVISFSLTHDVMLYTFFGVISPVAGATMGGVIVGSIADQIPDGSEDEGSWSAQASPRTDDDLLRRQTAATKKRA